MSQRNVFIALFITLFVYITGTIIVTSLESNLFSEWNFLSSIPWMKATLVDFYINIIVIFAWVAFKENNSVKSLIWLVFFVLLGAAATTIYVLVQLFKLKKNEPVQNAFLRSNN